MALPWHVNGEIQDATCQCRHTRWEGEDDPLDDCDRFARLESVVNLRHCVSQRNMGTPRRVLLIDEDNDDDNGIAVTAPFREAIQPTSTGDTLHPQLLEGNSIDADLLLRQGAPRNRLLRSRSQGWTLVRHSRQFRSEETGEAASSQMQQQRQRQQRLQQQQQFVPGAAALPAGMKTPVTAAALTLPVPSPRQSQSPLHQGPRSQFLRVYGKSDGTTRPASFQAFMFPLAPRVVCDMVAADGPNSKPDNNDDGSSHITRSYASAGEAVLVPVDRTSNGMTAGFAETSHRHSEHGSTRRGRRQNERRRTSCWTADDENDEDDVDVDADADGGDSHARSGNDRDSNDGDDSDDDASLEFVADGRRLLQTATSGLIAAAGRPLHCGRRAFPMPHENTGTGTCKPGSSYPSALITSAPACIPAPIPPPAVSSPAVPALTEQRPSARFLLFRSFQEHPWPPTPYTTEGGSGGRRPLPIPATLGRAASDEDPTSVTFGTAFVTASSIAPSCCAADEDSSRASSDNIGDDARSSSRSTVRGSSEGYVSKETPMLTAAEASAVAAVAAPTTPRAIALKGWSSQRVMTGSDSYRRRSVEFLNGAGNSADLAPKQQRPSIPQPRREGQQGQQQQQQVTCVPTSSTPRRLKPLTGSLDPTAGSWGSSDSPRTAATSGGFAWIRMTCTTPESDNGYNGTSGGEDGGSFGGSRGDVMRGAEMAVGPETPGGGPGGSACSGGGSGAADKELRLKLKPPLRLPPLLLPDTASPTGRQRSFAGVPWHIHSKSSSQLSVP